MVADIGHFPSFFTSVVAIQAFFRGTRPKQNTQVLVYEPKVAEDSRRGHPMTDPPSKEAPEVVHPGRLKQGHMFLITVNDTVTDETTGQDGWVRSKVLGPFMFVNKLEPLLSEGLPTGGHAQAFALNPKRGWIISKVILPKDGDNTIWGRLYQLHFATKTNLDYFAL